MSKNTPQEPANNPEPQAPQLSVAEFCARLSETVKRPELLNAFAATEQRAGRVSDTSDKFRARFDAFINQPV